MSAIDTPTPVEVAQIIDMHVEEELRAIEHYENREPLDESGVAALHMVSARIYALGYAAGRRYQIALSQAERQRQRDREAQS